MSKEKMHDVQQIINQQLGFGKWRSCDSALSRLRCTRNDDYKEIVGESEDSSDTPIFACKFAQKDGSRHLLALANEDGHVTVHDTESGQRFGCQAHHNAVFDIAWLCGQLRLVTVSGDHTARLFSLSEDSVRPERIFSAHTRSVKTVATRREDGAVFATGGRDGSVYVWDTRSSCAGSYLDVNAPDRTIQRSHQVGCGTPTGGKGKRRAWTGQGCVSGANSVTGLAFQEENTLISCGAGDGAIKVWDLRKNYRAYKRDPIPKHIIPYSGNTTRNGFSNLTIDQHGLKLYASCLDNTIYCYNVAACNPEPVMKYIGHENSTFYVKSGLSADGLYLLSGSSDHNAYIWNINNSFPLVKLVGHTAEVTSVAWRHVGDLAIITCSDDFKYKMWRIGPEEKPDEWEVIGCGNAERVRSAMLSNHLKRQLETSATTPLSQRKRAKENCNSTPKRKNLETLFNESKRLHTEDGPKIFLSQIDNQIQQDIPQIEITNRIQPATFPKQVFPPITDLPNFAVDGRAPHLRYSPQKCRDRDWLTKLRVEKSLIREMQQLAGPSPPKMPRLDFSPKSKAPQSPLLKFFKMTSSSIKCDK